MEKNEKNISKTIKRYPFNGRSNYLIDKFLIIGYNIPTLLKLLYDGDDDDNLSKNIIIDKKQNDDEKNKLLNIQPFHLKEEPILLNEFTSDFNKECLDFNMIKEMILPNNITLYYSEEEYSTYLKENKENENENDEFIQYEEYDTFDNDLLKENSVVFSSNPQTENNSKKSINGFAFIFYKKLKKRKLLSKKVIAFYIPIIFSIISEYPYYNSFYKLCKQIKFLFSYPEKEMPLEIIIYNIINNAQSPINSNVILSLKPFSFLFDENNNKKNISTIPESINEEDERSIIDESNDDIILKKNTANELLADKIVYTPIEINNDNKKKNPIKKFLKKNSQILNTDNNLINKKKKDIDNMHGLSPDTPRNMNESNIDNRRKKRKTFSNIDINPLLNKIKNKNKNSNKKLINYNVDEIFTKIKFELLKGYPLIQYNLAKVLFHTLSIEDIINIFFYSFLEKDIIFFSKNLEYLSLTINSYLNLNFPLNDEKYYFNNATVSYDNYINNNSTFVGSTFTTILGINDQYQPKYINSSNKLKEHLVVDLDKGEIHKIEDKKNKDNSKKNKAIFNLIKKICNKKEPKSDKKKRTILYKEVYLLNKKLNEIYTLLNNENETENKNNEQFKLFKNGSFLDYDDDKDNFIKKTNINIQDAFYRLLNNLCLYFYQNLSIRTDDDDLNKKNQAKTDKDMKKDKTEMNVIFKDDYKDEEDEEKKYTKEELYFLEELRETMKYESFVYSFVQSYSPIDLYKIPLTFTEEFLSIISRKNSILEKNINFFEIIDQLYGNKNCPSLEIDFKPFFSSYYKFFKDFFDREINDINEENIINEDLIKMKYILDKKKNKNYLKYRDYELDNNILMNYLNIINNLDEEKFNEIFYLSNDLKNNISQDILVIDVENLIENYSIETQLLSRSDLCCSNIILLFSLSLNFLDTNIDCQSFLSTLFHEFTVFRKYYSYVMNMIYILFSNYINKQDYTRADSYLLLYYICVNSIRNLKLVPNEGLMNIMKKFNEIDLKKYNDNLTQHQNSFINLKNQNNIIENKSELIEREELNTNNIFTIYNFTNKRFINDIEIIDKINLHVNNDFSVEFDKEYIQPRIKYNNNKINNIIKIESYFYSQTSLLAQLINAYNKYIIDLNEIHISYKLLIDSCLNILIYMRNCKEFKDKYEIKSIIEIIFFLFLNKLIETNKKLNIENNN